MSAAVTAAAITKMMTRIIHLRKLPTGFEAEFLFSRYAIINAMTAMIAVAIAILIKVSVFIERRTLPYSRQECNTILSSEDVPVRR